jgi:hypothetical protein
MLIGDDCDVGFWVVRDFVLDTDLAMHLSEVMTAFWPVFARMVATIDLLANGLTHRHSLRCLPAELHVRARFEHVVSHTTSPAVYCLSTASATTHPSAPACSRSSCCASRSTTASEPLFLLFCYFSFIFFRVNRIRPLILAICGACWIRIEAWRCGELLVCVIFCGVISSVKSQLGFPLWHRCRFSSSTDFCSILALHSHNLFLSPFNQALKI